MAIYEGITIKREWVVRTGNCKMKKGENRKVRFKLPFVPIFFYFPIHWVRFRSSFLVLVKSFPGVLVLSVAMPVNTGSNQGPVA